ncbi:putative hydrolase [Annulohypoxylon moriforme]|nr:putative hydrolase [Annulohypoxylon moriforme]
MSKHSEACCRIPPVVVEGYVPKGRYIELDGTRTYVTGPGNSDTAILSVYDIFGFFPQTIQGADILADGDAEKKYQVFMPDFFEGNPAKLEWYPPTDDEKKSKLGEWFQGAVWPKHLPKVRGFLEAAKKHNLNIKSWGIIGYCWGGKMASILSGDEEPLFKAAIQTSPAMIDPTDGAKVKIPTMMLASEEESVEDVKRYEENLKVPKHVEVFKDQLHGFMSARADLRDDKAKHEYERGYRLALKFFHSHL